jgi:hypothetical protein
VRRCTYGFAGVFPMFAAERVARRMRQAPSDARNRLPKVPPALERLLNGVSHAEARVLRHNDLPFGSSVFLAAVKPGH